RGAGRGELPRRHALPVGLSLPLWLSLRPAILRLSTLDGEAGGRHQRDERAGEQRGQPNDPHDAVRYTSMEFSAPVLERFRSASEQFARRLAAVAPEQWTGPTPCSEWNVRQLVNHMTRGNLNYVLLAGGGPAADFIRLRDVDALGDDPVGAYAASAEAC